MRAMLLPCSASGNEQPTIASSISAGIEARHLRHRRADRVHQQVVRPGVLEHAARRLADRGTGCRDYPGFLHLFRHLNSYRFC
jgi:hypothetical protein